MKVCSPIESKKEISFHTLMLSKYLQDNSTINPAVYDVCGPVTLKDTDRGDEERE